MDPFTLLALIFGGAFFLRKRQLPPVIVPADDTQPMTRTNGVVLYTDRLPPARGIEDKSASPIEQSGYIPPYIPNVPSSAVALGCSCEGMGALPSNFLNRRVPWAKTTAPTFAPTDYFWQIRSY